MPTQDERNGLNVEELAGVLRVAHEQMRTAREERQAEVAAYERFRVREAQIAVPWDEIRGWAGIRVPGNLDQIAPPPIPHTGTRPLGMETIQPRPQDRPFGRPFLDYARGVFRDYRGGEATLVGAEGLVGDATMEIRMDTLELHANTEGVRMQTGKAMSWSELAGEWDRIRYQIGSKERVWMAGSRAIELLGVIHRADWGMAREIAGVKVSPQIEKVVGKDLDFVKGTREVPGAAGRERTAVGGGVGAVNGMVYGAEAGMRTEGMGACKVDVMGMWSVGALEGEVIKAYFRQLPMYWLRVAVEVPSRENIAWLWKTMGAAPASWAQIVGEYTKKEKLWKFGAGAKECLRDWKRWGVAWEEAKRRGMGCCQSKEAFEARVGRARTKWGMR